jgi:uncharacterized protein
MNGDVLGWIDADGLSDLLAEVRRRLDDDPGHDLTHLLRVARWTVRIGGTAVERREAIAAALLHDVVNVPKDSPDRARASELSANLARELLPLHGFTAEATERVAAAVRDHSYSRGAVPESALGRALQDADRLEAVGAIGIFRTVTCGARMGARYTHPDDPWARDRPLDDARFTVDHFFEKLLGLGETMRTPAGRDEAARRIAFMRGFLEQLGHELGEPPPAETRR